MNACDDDLFSQLVHEVALAVLRLEARGRELGYRYSTSTTRSLIDATIAELTERQDIGARVVNLARERARRKGIVLVDEVPGNIPGENFTAAVSIAPERVQALIVALSPVANIPITRPELLRIATIRGFEALEADIARR